MLRTVKLTNVFISLISIINMVFAKVYTLDDLISEALKNSKSINSVEHEMQKAESYAKEVSAGSLPTISASMNTSHAFKSYVSGIQYDESLSEYLQYQGIDPYTEKGSYLIANSLEDIISNIGKQKKNTGTFGLRIDQIIYAQGKISIGSRIARIQRSTLNCKLQEEKFKVKGQIIKQFYASLLAQKNLQVAREAVNIAEETHRLTVLKYNAGKANELDTLNSKIHLKKTDIEFQNTESDLQIKYEALMNDAVIEEPVSTFSVEGIFPDAEFDMTLDMAIEKTKEKNYSLSQLNGLAEVQDLKVKLTKTAFSPTVFAGLSINKIGQIDHLNSANKFDWGDDQKIYIGANWDIYSGSAKIQRYHQAIADRNIFMLTQKQYTDDLVLATKSAYERVITSKKQITETAEIIALAEKSLSIARIAYEVGNTTYIDMQNTELELNKAKIMDNAVLFSFHCALTDLKILMGAL